MQSGIYLKGLDTLERKCNQIMKEVSKEKTKLLLKEARVVRDRIKSKAPKGPTGNLKKAVYAKAYAETTSSPAVAFAGIRPKKAPHAHLVEYGHGGPHPAPPHPFFRPALDEVMPKIKEDIAKELGRTIEGAI